jgi:hypothetical protein
MEGGMQDVRFVGPKDNTNTNHFVQVRYIINSDRRGWHYGYLGCKKTRNTNHRFEAFVCERLPAPPQNESSAKTQDGVPLLRVIRTCASPEWKMFCRRRLDPPSSHLITDASHKQWPELEPLSSITPLLNPSTGSAAGDSATKPTKSRRKPTASDSYSPTSTASARTSASKSRQSKSAAKPKTKTKQPTPTRTSRRQVVKSRKAKASLEQEQQQHPQPHASGNDNENNALNNAGTRKNTQSKPANSLSRGGGASNLTLDSAVLEETEECKMYLRSSQSVRRLAASGKFDKAYTFKRRAHPETTPSPVPSPSGPALGRSNTGGHFGTLCV